MPSRIPSRRFPVLLVFCALVCAPLLAQQEVGTITGQVRVVRGDAPPERIFVSLILRGASMASVYTDSEGRFGFYAIPPNSYYVDINDDHYQPVHVSADLNPMTTTAVVQITLVPKQSDASSQEKQLSGSNPNIMDIREYSKDFPKKAVKEFEKGVASDRDNKKDEAIAHYRKAIELAPDFYPAHNNLGSDELGLSHFDRAQAEFEKAIQLNQSDASAYFNLANVCLLTGQLQNSRNYLNEGFRRQPDSAMGKFLLGTLDIRAQDFPEAESALRQAVRLDPTMAQPRLQLINLFLKQGRQSDAVEQLHAFLSAFPASPFSAQVKQTLQRLEPSSAQAAAVSPAQTGAPGPAPSGTNVPPAQTAKTPSAPQN